MDARSETAQARANSRATRKTVAKFARDETGAGHMPDVTRARLVPHDAHVNPHCWAF